MGFVSNPIFELRALMDGLVLVDVDDQARFFELFGILQQKAVPELGNRLVRPSTPPGLKGLILEAASLYPYPEWTQHIQRALMHEQDVSVFSAGCTALAHYGTPESISALKELALSRGEPHLQAILSRELAVADPDEAFNHHFRRMLEGSRNPRTAVSAAENLVELATPGNFRQIQEGCRSLDPLAARLALQVISNMACAEAAAFLLDHFLESHRELLADRQLLDLLGRLRGRPVSDARAVLAEAALAALGARCPEAREDLDRVAQGGDAKGLGPLLSRLRGLAQGARETYLLDALGLLAEGKGSRLGALASETLDALRQRALRLDKALGRCAEGLCRRAAEGLVDGDRVLEAFTLAIRDRTAGPEVAQGFGTLLDPEDQRGLELILAAEDPAFRKAALESLGARREGCLLTFFLRAIEDPIQDLGLVAMEQLHRVPGSFPVVLEMLHSGRPAKVRQALRIFGHNRVRQAAESILDLLRELEREDLMLEALEALRGIGYPPALPVLARLLQPGVAPRLQQALAETILELQTPEALRILRDKAMAFKSASMRLMVLDGYARHHPDFFHPIPLEELPGLQALLEQCFEDREGPPHRFRTLVALPGIHVHDAEFYETMRARGLSCLEDRRSRAGWDHNQQNKVQTVLRELHQRAYRLAEGERREEELLLLLEGAWNPGPLRQTALQNLRDFLASANLVPSPSTSRHLLDFLFADCTREETSWEELRLLCEAAGFFGHPELPRLLHHLLLWSQDLPSQGALRLGRAILASLGRFGVEEADVETLPRLRRVLLLDPSAFFRKRLAEALQKRLPDLELSGASGPQAAESLMVRPVDFIVAELEASGASLAPWFRSQYVRRRCRGILLSTASRDEVDPQACPWIKAVFRKPFPLEALAEALAELGRG